MKILLIQDEMQAKGGASLYVKELAEELKKLNHQVKIFSYDSFSNKMGNPFFFSLVLFLEIRKKIKKFNPDVIHINNTHKFQNSIYLASYLAKPKNKIVKTFHDYWIIYPTRGMKIPEEDKEKIDLITRLIFPGRQIEKLLLKKFQNITPSKELKSKIEKLKIKVKHIDYFFNINLKKSAKEKNSLIYVGYFHENKGLKVLVEAFKILRRNNPEFTLTLVGEGPEKIPKMENLKIIPWKSKEELSKIYPKKEILIVPSTISEASPLVILEAMALGIPIIGSNVDGIREKILENKCGLIFEPGNPKDLAKKVIELIKDKRLYKKISKNGKTNSKKYSKEKHLKKIMKIYS